MRVRRRDAILAVFGLVLVLIGTVACAKAGSVGAFGPNPLTEALDQGAMGSRAAGDCNAVLKGDDEMEAALDATVSSIHEIVEGIDGVAPDWDYSMPTRSDTYVAVCIYQVDEPIDGRDVDYLAYWVSEDDGSGGARIIAWW